LVPNTMRGSSNLFVKLMRPTSDYRFPLTLKL
jgi:hypothetical protein